MVRLLQCYDPLFCHPVDLFDILEDPGRTFHCHKLQAFINIQIVACLTLFGINIKTYLI